MLPWNGSWKLSLAHHIHQEHRMRQLLTFTKIATVSTSIRTIKIRSRSILEITLRYFGARSLSALRNYVIVDSERSYVLIRGSQCARVFFFLPRIRRLEQRERTIRGTRIRSESIFRCFSRRNSEKTRVLLAGEGSVSSRKDQVRSSRRGRRKERRDKDTCALDNRRSLSSDFGRASTAGEIFFNERSLGDGGFRAS